MAIDWDALRAAATEAMGRAYAPYSNFPVGVAGLVDDGRVVLGCNVENASYGVGLCAECGLVSSLHATGGGRLVAVSCVDGAGEILMPCGRCRQLLYEHGGPECLVDFPDAPLRVADLLPHAFGPSDLDRQSRWSAPSGVPARLREWQGRGTVFVHPDTAAGVPVWTAYWERSVGFADENHSGFTDQSLSDGERGILEEGPTWPDLAAAVAWGRARTPRVVVVDAEGGLAWAGEADPPAEIKARWSPEEGRHE